MDTNKERQAAIMNEFMPRSLNLKGFVLKKSLFGQCIGMTSKICHTCCIFHSPFLAFVVI